MTEQPPGAIHSTTGLSAHFRQELIEALAALKIQTSEATEAYVVHVLQAFVRPEDAQRPALGFERPAALLFLEALEQRGAQRAQALRALGDACLYHCGFFEAHLARRGLNPRYYQSMGQQAYGHLRGELAHVGATSAAAQVFAELEQRFASLVRALHHVAAPTIYRAPEADEALARWLNGHG